MGIRICCYFIDMIPWPSFGLRVLGEMVAAVFLVDLISGILHLILDYADTGPLLRHTIALSYDEVHEIRRSSWRFHQSSLWLQTVWNFQSHHCAPYPEHDNQLVETAWIATPTLLATLVQYAVGWLDASHCRVWVWVMILGHCVQACHFLSHQRVHRGVESLPPFVRRLQDAGLMLHPDIHRRHHASFDCDFCIFNGWANPVVNLAYRVALRAGLVDPALRLQVPAAAAADAPNK